MAGLDGIRNKIEPADPVDKDLYELPPDEHADVDQVPGSLPEVLDALEADHDYLLEGGVFTPDLIETWIELQAHQRDRPDPAPPAPARVRALLRHLIRSRHQPRAHLLHAIGPEVSQFCRACGLDAPRLIPGALRPVDAIR